LEGLKRAEKEIVKERNTACVNQTAEGLSGSIKKLKTSIVLLYIKKLIE
jgi:hypothetical protein